jgi:RNA polymerase sigma-70 factor (ECF subfamily)
MTTATPKRAPDATDRRDLYRALWAWTGNPDTAEDLVQQALFEAWRSDRQPETDAEWRPWLFGVARKVLLRWQRDAAKYSRRVSSAPASEHHLLAASACDDLDSLVTRADIGDLLDAALGRLPRETRQALVLKYIDDLPQAEIAARMGVHEKALEGRLHRGKRAMHRFLLFEKPDTAISMGIVTERDTWVSTTIWCTSCGRNRLVGRWWEDGYVRLDCPSCVDWAPAEHSRVFCAGYVRSTSRSRPSFAKAMNLISCGLGALGTDGRDMTMSCSRCGGIVRPVEHPEPSDIPLPPGPSLRFECTACRHVEGFSWLPGNDSGREDVRAWRHQHPRTRMMRPTLVRYQGRDAVASSWQALDADESLTIIHDLETYRAVHVDIAPGAR